MHDSSFDHIDDDDDDANDWKKNKKVCLNFEYHRMKCLRIENAM